MYLFSFKFFNIIYGLQWITPIDFHMESNGFPKLHKDSNGFHITIWVLMDSPMDST